MQKDHTIRDVIKAVAEAFEVTVEALTGRTQRRRIFEARAACAYVLRQCYPSMGLVEIGFWLGRRDHTTIMNQLDRVEEHIQEDPGYAELVRSLIAAYQPARPISTGAEIRRQAKEHQRDARMRWAGLSVPYRPIAA